MLTDLFTGLRISQMLLNDVEYLPSASTAEHVGSRHSDPATSNGQDGDQGEDGSYESSPERPPQKRKKG